MTVSISVRPFAGKNVEEWNGFLVNSKNGLFQFNRHYMDYHSDLFHDASLMFYEEDRLVALLPANAENNVLHSHQGLTFGGLLTDERMSTPLMLRVFDALIARLQGDGYKQLTYKAIPIFYQKIPAQEDLYALSSRGASCDRIEVTTTIDYRRRGRVSQRRRRGVKKAQKVGLHFNKSLYWQGFWQILLENLQARHDVRPTHSLEEIALLAERFPNNIKLYTSSRGKELLAGVVIYETSTVAHSQYIASVPDGRACGALDGLFEFLIEEYSETKRYFDFGISTENCGKSINEGLITQKEEFGGSAFVLQRFVLNLT